MTPAPPVPGISTAVPLADRTTLRVGGCARFLQSATSVDDVQAGLAWARSQGLPVFVLGGGSNVIVPDDGVDGLVIQPMIRGIDVLLQTDRDVILRVGAGENHDDFVAHCVDRNWQGLECLSGIPGWIGAAPVQNIGAYGQEIAECVEAVDAVHRETGQARHFRAFECGFEYRDSRFKRDGCWLITHVTLRVRVGADAVVRYPGLAARLPEQPTPASLADVRATVIAVRREKSMVPAAFAQADDPNLRSAGSWFTNPLVTPETAECVRAIAALVAPDDELPVYPAGPGLVKLPAAWLIERAGLSRGWIDHANGGAAGLSTTHTLALVNRGDARAADMLATESSIRERVEQVFGVTLRREPVLLRA